MNINLNLLKVKELKIKCKELNIKKYSKLKKNELIILIENKIKKKEIEQIQTENIFCYPDILNIIYEYININNLNEERKKIIKKAKEEHDIIFQYYWTYSHLKTIEEQKDYLKSINYNNINELEDKEKLYRILKSDFENELLCSSKQVLYIWLTALQYKVKKNLCKSELIYLVEKYYFELELNNRRAKRLFKEFKDLFS